MSDLISIICDDLENPENRLEFEIETIQLDILFNVKKELKKQKITYQDLAKCLDFTLEEVNEMFAIDKIIGFVDIAKMQIFLKTRFVPKMEIKNDEN